MANRDDSTESKRARRLKPRDETKSEEKSERFFPTGLDLASARRAAGKIKPNQPNTLDELFEVADRLREERG